MCDIRQVASSLSASVLMGIMSLTLQGCEAGDKVQGDEHSEWYMAVTIGVSVGSW